MIQTPTEPRQRPLPIIEVFGPTLQGEGPLIGMRTMFIRTGGCNYRCAWCDTLYAVLPEEVGRNAKWMTPNQIAASIRGYRETVDWVTISGGNPAIHDLTNLIYALHEDGWRICIETQGDPPLAPMWFSLLGEPDTVVWSPKPPSSGMVYDHEAAATWIQSVPTTIPHHLKTVVMDEDDLRWVKELLKFIHDNHLSTYLTSITIQVGTDPGDQAVASILTRAKWLWEALTSDHDPIWRNVRLLPQWHVLVHGPKRGI
jgi:7-carboxy-7-deazaguanine synthase